MQTVSLLRHGTWWDRIKSEPLDEVMGGRFTRLFPNLPTASFKQRDLEELARVMIAPEEPKQEGIDDPEQEGMDDPEENQGRRGARHACARV